MRGMRIGTIRGVSRMYLEISKRIEVSDEAALEYAMNECGIEQIQDAPMSGEFKAALVEWFYSGNWVHKEEAS